MINNLWLTGMPVATYFKTRSVLWCCISAVAAYVLLTLL